MQARMKNPGKVLPDATQAIQLLVSSIQKSGISPQLMNLVHLRVSQVNGCSFCVDSGVKHAQRSGETEERLFGVAAWRDMPYFTEAERAALALAESMTCLSYQAGAVPDGVWNDAIQHFGEEALSGLVLWIATTNLFNRVNVTTRQVAGSGW